MGIRKATVFMALTLLVFALYIPVALGQEVYDLKVIAQTGVAIGSGIPVALGTGPSINDAGKVAFIARDTDATHGRVMLLNNGAVERDCFIGTIASVDGAVQANDSDQVIFRMNTDDGLFSDVVRLDTSCSGPIIGRGSLSPSFPQPFDVVLPSPTLNDNGRGVFSADIGSNTMLGSRASGSGSYNISPVLTGFPNLFPMLANNDTTVVRWGGSITSPLLRFIDTATTFNTANFIAEDVDFNAIGEQPGTSDDGNVVAFAGDHKTTGLGIYVSLFAGGSFTPVKIVGTEGIFSNFSLQPRVGVNRSTPASTTQYTLAYIGFDIFGTLGLYTTTIDITNPASPAVLKTSLLAAVGDKIHGVTGVVNNIKVYDPVNNNGEVVFWVSTDTGAQAIVRATPSIDAFDLACELLPSQCEGQFLKEVDNAVMVDETKLDDIVLSDIQRRGVVADGVSKLLLRIKTNEQVTFVLKDPQGQTADDQWGTLSDVAGTTTGNTIVVNPVATNEGQAAFVVYQAPMDLPCSYNILPCALNEIAGGLQVTVSAFSASNNWQKLLNLVPPPLVFVHGVWSDWKAWRAMSSFLKQQGFSVCPGYLSR